MSEDARYTTFRGRRMLRVAGGDGTETEVPNEKLGEQIEELTGKAQDLLDKLGESPDPADVKAVQDEIGNIQAKVQPLLDEQKDRLIQASVKSLTGRVTTLQEVVEDLRASARMPSLPEFGVRAGDDVALYEKGERSLFKDIMLTHNGGKAGVDAMQRLEEGLGGKAMTEGTESAGGYLVEPERIPGLLQARERQPVLYNLIPRVRVNTDKVEFVSVLSGLVAGWVAELAEKPAGDMTFGTLEASVFTAAGLAVTSNQLLEDSSIDVLIAQELEKRVGNVVEAGILTGTGTGQPRGILNTSGIQSEVYTDASPTVLELLGAIARAIAKVQNNHLGEPTHIVLRPQTWTAIVTSQDAAGTFTFGSGQSDPSARSAADPFPGRRLFGYPVVLSGNVPSNLGAGTNETRVIVADLSEQLVLDRSGLAVDKSEHVYFTTNQTVFRGERRVGFTAGRYPLSICVVSGTGLVNTSF